MIRTFCSNRELVLHLTINSSTCLFSVGYECPTSSSRGLSLQPAAIAGICIGALFVVCIIILFVVLILSNRSSRPRRRVDPTQSAHGARAPAVVQVSPPTFVHESVDEVHTSKAYEANVARNAARVFNDDAYGVPPPAVYHSPEY